MNWKFWKCKKKKENIKIEEPTAIRLCWRCGKEIHYHGRYVILPFSSKGGFGQLEVNGYSLGLCLDCILLGARGFIKALYNKESK